MYFLNNALTTFFSMILQMFFFIVNWISSTRNCEN